MSLFSPDWTQFWKTRKFCWKVEKWSWGTYAHRRETGSDRWMAKDWKSQRWKKKGREKWRPLFSFLFAWHAQDLAVLYFRNGKDFARPWTSLSLHISSLWCYGCWFLPVPFHSPKRVLYTVLPGNPMHAYSEANPMIFNGAYSLVSILRIASSNNIWRDNLATFRLYLSTSFKVEIKLKSIFAVCPIHHRQNCQRGDDAQNMSTVFIMKLKHPGIWWIVWS